MRLFYGLSLPDDIRAEAAFTARRAEARMPGRYGVPSNYHITLAFLQAILAGHIAQMPAPTITLGPVDFFGRAENAILILRALCNPPLDALHNALAADAQACGLPVDPGPFAPHITLARHAQTTAEALAAVSVSPLSFAPKSAHLFLSARDDADALRYTPLFSADFASFVSL